MFDSVLCRFGVAFRRYTYLAFLDALNTGQLSARIIAHKPYPRVIKNDFRPPRFETGTLCSGDLLSSGHVSIYIMVYGGIAGNRRTFLITLYRVIFLHGKKFCILGDPHIADKRKKVYARER